MYKLRPITVLIPCVHAPSHLKSLVATVPAFVDEIIVFVDANSRDPVGKLDGSERIRIIPVDVHGDSLAMQNGIRQAKGEIIVSLDPDHLFPVDAVSYLLEVFLRSDVRFVSASRFFPGSQNVMSLKFRLGDRLLSLIFSLLYLRWVSDSLSGVWICERAILNEMNLIGDMLAIYQELKIEAIRNPGIGFMEIYLEFSSRSGDKQVRPLRDGMHNLLFMIRKRFTRPARSVSPDASPAC